MNEGTQTAAMMGQMNQMVQQTQPVTALTEDDIMGKLKKLKDLFDAGLIDEDEFKTKKSELLSKL